MNSINENSTLFNIKSVDSPFKFYRTATSMTSLKHHPSITVLKDTPFLLVPTDNSYAIYDLQDLKLQFLGEKFTNINCITQYQAFVYVCSNNTIFKTVRGEIVSSKHFDNCFITKMIIFGSFFIIKCENELIICENDENNNSSDLIADNINDKINTNKEFLKEISRLKFPNKITDVFHPLSYVNKILISFDNGESQLYNIVSDKKIFEFSFGKILSISQTSVVDVFGFVMSTGIIKIYNIKKDKLIFEINDYIGENIRKVDFKDNIAMILTGNLILYDLEIKKEFYKRNDVSSGILINKDTLLVTTESSIEIITLDDLNILKSRKIMNKNITKLYQYSPNELILVSNKDLFKMNVYRDEMNQYLKVKHPIEMIDIENEGSIMVYGENKLSYIDKEGRFYNCITQKSNFVKIFKEFCIFGTKSKVVIMNLKSKRIVLTFPISSDDIVLDAIFNNNSFTVLYSNKIVQYCLESKLIFEYNLEIALSKGSLRVNKELYFVMNYEKDELLVISPLKNDNYVFNIRKFNISKYVIDDFCKILIGINKNSVLVFDILSGNQLEVIETNKTLIDVAILDNLKFIALLDSDSHVHILSKQYFSSNINDVIYGTSKSILEVPMIKKESNFYKDLMIYKSYSNTSDYDLIIRGLNKDEVKELLQIIKKNLKTDFFSSQKLLNKILLYKNSLISKADIFEIKESVDQKLKEIEECVLKGINNL